MNSGMPVELPRPSGTGLLWVGIALIVLFWFAVVLEFVRRRLNRRSQLRDEWELVRQTIQDKGFSDTESNLVQDAIERWNPNAPLETILARRVFDRCVDKEMERLTSRVDLERYREAGLSFYAIRKLLGLDYVPYGQRVYSTRELTLETTLWMSPAGVDPPQWRRATVAALDDAFIHVAPDDRAKAPLELRPGDAVRCSFWREDDARYVFMGIIAEVQGDPFRWLSYHTSDVNRLQSRNYFRVHCNKALQVGIIVGSGNDANQEPAEREITMKLPGRLASLSAGGLAVVTQQPVSRRSLLRVPLELPGESPIEVDASIVGIESLPANEYLVRGQFLDIGEEARDAIARYVVRRQQPHAGKNAVSPRME